MNLPIHSITLGKDGYVYLCLKVPAIEGTERRSEYVTVKFTANSFDKLRELKEQQPKD